MKHIYYFNLSSQIGIISTSALKLGCLARTQQNYFATKNYLVDLMLPQLMHRAGYDLHRGKQSSYVYRYRDRIIIGE